MPLKSVEHFIAFQPIVLVLQPETFNFFIAVAVMY